MRPPSPLWIILSFPDITSTFSFSHFRNKRIHAPVLEARNSDETRKGYRYQKTEGGFEKYFHEPGGEPEADPLGNHYDNRYYHGIQGYDDRRDTQLYMLRAYLTFFQDEGLETWLAHGTLLGWWWNGKMLPWDWDIDAQVSGYTLAYLGQHYNGTVYQYPAADDPPTERSYLLDVNPASVERDRGNGLNIIDARWIDVRSGLYIDITGLSETHPDDRPGLWSCKNYHRYQTTDLYPMRETMFENVTAKVPFAYDMVLTQEYEQKALILTEYEGHRWNPDLKDWIKKTDEEIAAEQAARDVQKHKEEEIIRLREEAERKEEEERPTS